MKNAIQLMIVGVMKLVNMKWTVVVTTMIVPAPSILFQVVHVSYA